MKDPQPIISYGDNDWSLCLYVSLGFVGAHLILHRGPVRDALLLEKLCLFTPVRRYPFTMHVSYCENLKHRRLNVSEV